MNKLITVCLALFCSQSIAENLVCSKARSNFAQTIYTDAELAALDRNLKQEYALARAQLSPAAENNLMTSQRSWLQFFDSYCFVDFQAIPTSTDETKRCLSQALQERTKELSETGKIIGGMKTYTVIDHHIRVSKKQGEIYVLQRSYMQVDDDSAYAGTLNSFLKIKDNAELQNERGAENYQVTLTQISADWLYRQEHSEIFTGAYPTSGTACGLYSLRLNRPLKVSDIFKNQKWRKVATRTINHHFHELSQTVKEFDLSSFQEIEVIDTQQTADFTFCISEKGLELYGFLPHVARAYDGVTVSWKSLEASLTADAKTQVKEVISTKSLNKY